MQARFETANLHIFPDIITDLAYFFIKDVCGLRYDCQFAVFNLSDMFTVSTSMGNRMVSAVA